MQARTPHYLPHSAYQTHAATKADSSAPLSPASEFSARLETASVVADHGHDATTKRAARIFVPVASLQPPPPSNTAAGRPQLFLLRQPVSPGSPRPSSSPSPSPSGRSFPSTPSTPMTPLTPLTPAPVPDPRRKMAKLTRTLGRPPPAELVFAAEHERLMPSKHVVPAILGALGPAPPRIPRRQRQRQHPGPAPSVSSASDYSAASSASHLSLHRTHSAFSFDSAATGHSAPSAPGLRPASPAPPQWHIDDAPAHPSTTSGATRHARYLSREIAFSAPSSRAASPASGPDSDDESPAEDGLRRHEAREGWSGEWRGAAGMHDVVARLRELR
ncbi:hypothetical protein MIND_00402700 [Mycena indigotica]|uniref:Uncharacterized protein n=1 Tax=Mycena indigotica TaxID=2126181 RepID=A0A8H6T5F2_9AGAR|nr:uncharacterized protein MIND_00402700 [Mycena indigotica]KAF7310287.1 hypothetical protein MIND_00402700 [Mycena indigotica]